MAVFLLKSHEEGGLRYCCWQVLVACETVGAISSSSSGLEFAE